jgi:heptosyltransferase-1
MGVDAPVACAAVKRRILVVRLSAFGDIVLTTTLLHGIRRNWPDAHVGWIVDDRFAGALESHPGIDVLHRWRRQEWSRALRSGSLGTLASGIVSMRRELRAQGYDLALDAQGLAKSALLARLAGAKEQWSLRPRECAGLISGRAVQVRMQRQLVGDEYRMMLAAIGADFAGSMPWMPVREDADLQAKALLEVAGARQGFVAICPFTTRPQKHWFDARWVRLASALESHGMSTVVLGGPQDEAAAAQLVDQMADAGASAARSIAGRTTLANVGAVLARAACTVGVDTGLTHLSIAVGTRTIALFGSALPYVQVPSPHRLIRQPLACSPCDRRPTCSGRFDCMRAIEVDQVMDAVLG